MYIFTELYWRLVWNRKGGPAWQTFNF